MTAKYEIGQQIRIKPVNKDGLSTRDPALYQYAGKIGEVIDYYWIRPPIGEVFYLYTVQIANNYKEIVMYEDELEHV